MLLQRLAELAKRSIPGVAEASVSLITDDTASSVAYTGQLALDLDESQYGRGYGPCLEAAIREEIWRSATPAPGPVGPTTRRSLSSAVR